MSPPNHLHLDPFLSSYPPQSSPSLVSSPPNYHHELIVASDRGQGGAVAHCRRRPRRRRSRRGRVIRRPCQLPSIPSHVLTLSPPTKVTAIRLPYLGRCQLPRPSLRRRLIVSSRGFSPSHLPPPHPPLHAMTLSRRRRLIVASRRRRLVVASRRHRLVVASRRRRFVVVSRGFSPLISLNRLRLFTP